MLVIGVTLGWIVGLLVVALLLRHFLAQRIVQRRLFESFPEIPQATFTPDQRVDAVAVRSRVDEFGRLPTRGLVPVFVALTMLSVAVGGSIGYACWIFGVLAAADRRFR